MVTHILTKIENDLWSYRKDYMRGDAIASLIFKNPVLSEQYDKLYDELGRAIEAQDIMVKQYNMRVIKEEPLILDSDDEWGFAVAYDIEWDGLSEEEL